MDVTLRPGDTIGIIGGGQLGRMLALAAARLGFKTIILDPDENAPASQCSNDQIVAPYDSFEALGELASRSHVITYEFENVNVDTIRRLEDDHACHPNTKALATSQDRLVEKRFFNDLGIATAPFFEVSNADDLHNALAQSGDEGILKTRRFGYDGKGQIRLKPGDGPQLAVANTLANEKPCILEGLVEFKCEISIIAARGTDGGFASFDVAENVHRDGILFTSTVPANVQKSTTDKAREVAEKVLQALEYVGVIGIEFFVIQDDTLVANEYAPRVHNSGHWTEAACTVSQFEQHIRAIAGLPLGNGNRHSDCVMQNLIGEEVDAVAEIAASDDAMLHLYGKAETRPGRKMGHFTKIL
ncbi:MAG: 5-(carboxyamino)imidazole ribonucleotide synthase [Pseudomonadota bacterium]